MRLGTWQSRYKRPLQIQDGGREPSGGVGEGKYGLVQRNAEGVLHEGAAGLNAGAQGWIAAMEFGAEGSVGEGPVGLGPDGAAGGSTGTRIRVGWPGIEDNAGSISERRPAGVLGGL